MRVTRSTPAVFRSGVIGKSMLTDAKGRSCEVVVVVAKEAVFVVAAWLLLLSDSTNSLERVVIVISALSQRLVAHVDRCAKRVRSSASSVAGGVLTLSIWVVRSSRI